MDLIEVAKLMLEVDKFGRLQDTEKLERELAHLNCQKFSRLFLAYKILEGKPYSVFTDNPETVRNMREFGRALGATERSMTEDGGITRIVWDPPARH